MITPRRLLAIFLVQAAFIFLARPALAQRVSPTLGVGTEAAVLATTSAEATPSAEVFTPLEVVQPKGDITETTGPSVGKLGQYVLSHETGPLNPTNFLQHAIRTAVLAGIPGGTIVLIVLFPLVAALIAGARHLIGLRGFGIFTPAVLSVAFMATGIITGILLFLVILLMATLGRKILRKAKLQYLPRMALLLWFVSVGVLGVLLVAPYIQFQNLVNLSIFPILILILLAETFIEVQIGKSPREARDLTVETILLALISSLVLSLDMVQRFALIYPELLLLFVAVFDVFMGRYTGLRYTEYKKFKQILK